MKKIPEIAVVANGHQVPDNIVRRCFFHTPPYATLTEVEMLGPASARFAYEVAGAKLPVREIVEL